MSNLKDIRNKPVSIELGGKDRTIKFDLNAFAELEERYGNVQNAMREMQSGSMKGIKTVLWAGLIHEEAVIDEKTGEPIKYNITPYNVGSWISPDSLPDISMKLAEAMGYSIPDIDKMPEVKKQLEELGIDVNALKDSNGQEIAKVVLTEDEKKEEEKNV